MFFGCYEQPWLFSLSQAMMRGKRAVKRKKGQNSNRTRTIAGSSLSYPPPQLLESKKPIQRACLQATLEGAAWVRALAGDVFLPSWARHLTLTVPLSTQEYKWLPANCLGSLTNCRGVTCDGLASCLREVATSCYRSWDKLQPLHCMNQSWLHLPELQPFVSLCSLSLLPCCSSLVNCSPEVCFGL